MIGQSFLKSKLAHFLTRTFSVQTLKKSGTQTAFIQAVDIDATAFIGCTLKGSDGDVSRSITNFAQFVEHFGGLDDIIGVDGSPRTNFVAQGVKAFFENGGRRAHVARIAANAPEEYQKALDRLATISAIGLLSAPDAAALPHDHHTFVTDALVRNAEQMRYRIALLDAARDVKPNDCYAIRERISSAHAALYVPWIVGLDTSSGRSVVLPPSAFIAGLIARLDSQGCIYKSLGSEPLKGAIGIDRKIEINEQDFLNQQHINTIRSSADGDIALWGTRTLSHDPQWKYLNVRRYFLFLEKSIYNGTQWATSEPNHELLWIRLKQTIANFLYNEWHRGALTGMTPEQAFFVRCDRSTMTAQDVRERRVVCEIGFALLNPAEFLVFRIMHNTA